MNDNEIMKQWERSSIVVGSPTNILTTLTSLTPVIWLCTTYDRWPPISTVLTAWDMVAASFGVFYFVESVSYYAALGMTGAYLSFLSGSVGGMRVPYAALTLDVTHSTPDTIQAEVVSAMVICGSITADLISTTSIIIVGGAVLSVFPEFIVVGLMKYTSSAIFGATFGNLAVKYPEVAVFVLAIPVTLKMTTGPPAAAVIVCTVFGTLLVARIFYKKGLVR